MSQRPRPMEASHWDTLQTDATHFRVPLDLDDDPQMPWEDEDEDEDMDEEEDEEGQQNQDEVGPLDEQVRALPCLASQYAKFYRYLPLGV